MNNLLILKDGKDFFLSVLRDITIDVTAGHFEIIGLPDSSSEDLIRFPVRAIHRPLILSAVVASG